MCRRCQATRGTGENPVRRDGSETCRDRQEGEGLRAEARRKFAGLALHQRHAAASSATIRHRSEGWQSTKLHQYFSQSGAVFQIHIDKFKGHRLRTRAPDNSLSLDVPHSLRKLERKERTGREVAFTGADASAEIELRDGKTEIFAQVGSYRDKISRKFEPSIAS